MCYFKTSQHNTHSLCAFISNRYINYYPGYSLEMSLYHDENNWFGGQKRHLFLKGESDENKVVKRTLYTLNIRLSLPIISYLKMVQYVTSFKFRSLWFSPDTLLFLKSLVMGSVPQTETHRSSTSYAEFRFYFALRYCPSTTRKK